VKDQLVNLEVHRHVELGDDLDGASALVDGEVLGGDGQVEDAGLL